MKTIIVDDEVLALEKFTIECEDIDEITIVGKFESSKEALDFTEKNRVELAVLDIEMPDINGIELAQKLRSIYPDIIIIIATGYSQYALDAYNVKAVAYLLKPYNREDLIYAIHTAKLLSKGQNKRVFIRTFGRFEVFLDNKPVIFKSAKAKELLALLVDYRGGTVNTELGIMMLWEDKPYDNRSQSLYRKVAKSLRNTLEEAGIEDILINNRFSRSINVEKFDCDYYQFLNGDKEAFEKFNGEYMSNYSWGEETLAKLVQRIYNMEKF